MINIFKLFSFVAMLGAFLFHAPGLKAQNIADTPCDPEYFESLEARAWLEAQREITQNQNLITKPDSVLAYSCFNQFGKVLAQQAQNMFSETQRWSGTGIGTDSMDNALNALVQPSLNAYLTGNFYPDGNHTYLGGRGPSPYTESDMAGGTYNCSQMNEIWKIAKCYDFQTESHDGFFTFEEHASEDKRQLPSSCSNPNWNDPIQTAGLNPASAPNWPFDKVEPYYDRFDPASCGSYPPIPTGVTVTTNVQALPADYEEKACIIPGCIYDPNANSCTSL